MLIYLIFLFLFYFELFLPYFHVLNQLDDTVYHFLHSYHFSARDMESRLRTTAAMGATMTAIRGRVAPPPMMEMAIMELIAPAPPQTMAIIRTMARRAFSTPKRNISGSVMDVMITAPQKEINRKENNPSFFLCIKLEIKFLICS